MTLVPGDISLIIGPMFSGKSTELFRKLRREKVASKRCLLIKYAGDNRYSVDKASSHDKYMMSAISLQKLSELTDTFNWEGTVCSLADIDVIGIDEGQFFPDIAEFSELWSSKGIKVIIAALDGDFKRKPFGNILDVVPISKKVNKLTAVCMAKDENDKVCGEPASFSKRIVESNAVELIGGSESYIATCHKCYLS